MKREVGQGEQPAVKDPVPVLGDLDSVDLPQVSGSVSGLADGQSMSSRLASLEAEVRGLRRIVQHERKLLRKAVLLQLDLEAYDDID
jgi:hypothetical protein